MPQSNIYIQMTLYNQKDRTRQENIWRECERKEHKHFSLGKHFQMNLLRPSPSLDSIKFSHNRIELVTEKEIVKSPLARKSAKELEFGFEVSMIKHVSKKPQERWAIPFTTSHDMGWLLQRPMQSDELYELSKQNKMSMTQPSPNIHSFDDTRLTQSATTLQSLRSINCAKWRRPKTRSDVVRYAEAYTMCLGSSPFGRGR